MTAPGNGSAGVPSGSSSQSLDDQLVRIVVASMNSVVDRLQRAGSTRGLGTPEGAAHVRRLSQVVAGVALDALRTWPLVRKQAK